jgi:hypothetical protein
MVSLVCNRYDFLLLILFVYIFFQLLKKSQASVYSIVMAPPGPVLRPIGPPAQRTGEKWRWIPPIRRRQLNHRPPPPPPQAFLLLAKVRITLTGGFLPMNCSNVSHHRLNMEVDLQNLFGHHLT